MSESLVSEAQVRSNVKLIGTRREKKKKEDSERILSEKGKRHERSEASKQTRSFMRDLSSCGGCAADVPHDAVDFGGGGGRTGE
jgi:hypothetical protein